MVRPAKCSRIARATGSRPVRIIGASWYPFLKAYERRLLEGVHPPDAEWGNPTRMRYDGDQLTVTEVNRDGSTDTRTSDTLTWEWSDRHTPFCWNLGPIDWGRIQS
ncbi:MAG: hypothetical protein AMXMBFR33_16350 [Candidatus Xenobia bacterium]